MNQIPALFVATPITLEIDPETGECLLTATAHVGHRAPAVSAGGAEFGAFRGLPPVVATMVLTASVRQTLLDALLSAETFELRGEPVPTQ
jgi:hypothetical protein